MALGLIVSFRLPQFRATYSCLLTVHSMRRTGGGPTAPQMHAAAILDRLARLEDEQKARNVKYMASAAAAAAARPALDEDGNCEMTDAEIARADDMLHPRPEEKSARPALSPSARAAHQLTRFANLNEMLYARTRTTRYTRPF